MSKNIIQPKILKGTRDFLPKDMVKRKYVMNKIENIFKQFGYDTIETPVIEYAETILGKYGEEGDQLTYAFKDRGDRNIALRYDQTVPTARFVAMYANDLPLPFKRYQISRVWRADKPQKGRFREFYQCDIDIIGTESLIADAEVAKVIYQVFSQLGFKKFTIKINTRRLTNAIFKNVGVDPEKRIEMIRTIDKLDKIGEDGVKKELNEKGITESNIDKIFKIMRIKGNNKEKLKEINLPECDEISQFLQYCESFNIPDDFIEVDLTLARGLDYYTGIIFETVIEEPNLGSLCGGGRYDDLCSLFSKRAFPGTGVAFGFERIVMAMDELKMLEEVDLNSKVLVTIFDDNSIDNSIKILNEIQNNNINAEIYIENDKLGKQLKYADKKEIPYVIIQGPDELAEDKVQLKDMLSGEKSILPLSEAIKKLR